MNSELPIKIRQCWSQASLHSFTPTYAGAHTTQPYLMLRHCLVPLIVLAAALALLSGASAQETFACKAVAEGGAWELPATWVDCNNATPGVNDSATVSGENAHVTIKSGLLVEVASLSVEESAQLTNAGTTNTWFLGTGVDKKKTPRTTRTDPHTRYN